MLGGLGSALATGAKAVGGVAGATGSMVGSKVDGLLNGPKKALLVLHYTPAEAKGGAIGGKSSGFSSVVEQTREKLEDAGQDTDIQGKGDYVLEVQYNPQTLEMTAAADSMPIKPLQPSFDANVPLSASVPPSIIMKVEFIFDDIVVPDAFMYDKFNVSAGNIANDIVLNKDSLNGKAHSVQPVTNGLLAAMQRTQTRSISFYWADMHFHGEIKDMQARYTLFSLSGRPIRSIVSMTLVQNSAAQNEAINDYWESALDYIFPQNEIDPMKKDKYSARAIAQRMGALLNINF